MKTDEILTKALAAGAVVMNQPNQTAGREKAETLDDAYRELKRMIREQYSQVDVDMLDRGPGSAEAQEAMTAQLNEAGVSEDKAIVGQARLVLERIQKEEPEALWASEEAKTPSHLK